MIIGALGVSVTVLLGVYAIYYVGFRTEPEYETDKTNERVITNTVPLEVTDKRYYYDVCVKKRFLHGDSKIYENMRKIDEYLTTYDMKQFDRFYTIYCKELYSFLMAIDKSVSERLRNSSKVKACNTYGPIFSKMRENIEQEIERINNKDVDIEAIKNYAKINGDFDEKYNVKAHDTTLTASANDLRNSISSAIKAGNARSARLNALDLESGKSWDFFSGWDSMSEEAKRDYIREVQYLNIIVKDKTDDMFSSFGDKHIDLIECTFKDIAEHFSDGTVFTYCGVPVTIYDVSETCCKDIYHTQVTIQYPNGMVEALEYDKRGGGIL